MSGEFPHSPGGKEEWIVASMCGLPEAEYFVGGGRVSNAPRC